MAAIWSRRSAIAAPAIRRRMPSAPTRRDQALGGSRVDGMFAPRLDGAARGGLKSWSADDIAEYLQSGRNARSHAGLADVGGRRQFHLEDERRRCPRHRRLPEIPALPARRSLWSARHRRRRWRTARRSTAAPASPATRPTAPARRASTRRCLPTPTCNPPTPPAPSASSSTARESITTPRAPNKGSMPAYADKALRPGDRRCHDLHPQCLGQCGAGSDGGGGRESAEVRVTSSLRTRISASPICSGSRAGETKCRARR